LEGCCFVFGSRLQIDPASLLTPYVKLMGNVIDGQAPLSPPGHSLSFYSWPLRTVSLALPL
jgi:hypothetical protein